MELARKQFPQAAAAVYSGEGAGLQPLLGYPRPPFFPLRLLQLNVAAGPAKLT